MKDTTSNHTTKNPFRAGSLSSAALITLTAFAIASTAKAQRTNTWTGSSGNAHWFGAANWDMSSLQDFDDLVFTGTTRLNHKSWSNLDGTDNDFDINSITFDNAAGAFVISTGDGGGGGGTIKLHGDITNNDADLQTMNFNFQLNADVTANAAAGDITIGGVISEDVAGRQLTKTGDGTLTLTKANTYSGTTAIAGVDSATSTVNIQHDSALGTGEFQFQRGGILELGVDGLTINNFMSLPNWSAGTRIFRLDLGGAQVGEFAGDMWHQHTTQGKLVFDVGTEDTMTYSGDIEAGSASGAGLTKTGVGTLVLSGTNTYKGTTTISAGTLKLSGGSAISDTGNIWFDSGATLDLNGTSERINRLAGAGIVDNSAGNGTLVVAESNNFSGTLQNTNGTLKLQKIGAGTVTLTESSTYSGGTDIYEGTIVANHSAALGTGQIYMGVTNNATQTLAIGADGVNIANNFFLQNSNSTHEIKFDVAGSNASTLSGNMTNQVGYGGKWDFIVGADDTLTVSGILKNGSAGGSGIDKDGSGTLVLSGANTYKGKTRINEGTLSLATGYTHSKTGNYELGGGTLEIADGVNISGHTIVINSGGVISPGNSPGTATTGAQTWNDEGSYLWEINNSNGTKGADEGWDWLDIDGTLDLTNLSTGGFTIDITSLTTANDPGFAAGFSYSGLAYGDSFGTTFIIASANTISGFDAGLFTLDDSAFVNGKLDWSIIESGNDLVLSAVFVPEPSSTALLGLGLSSLLLRRKRS